MTFHYFYMNDIHDSYKWNIEKEGYFYIGQEDLWHNIVFIFQMLVQAHFSAIVLTVI